MSQFQRLQTSVVVFFYSCSMLPSFRSITELEHWLPRSLSTCSREKVLIMYRKRGSLQKLERITANWFSNFSAPSQAPSLGWIFFMTMGSATIYSTLVLRQRIFTHIFVSQKLKNKLRSKRVKINVLISYKRLSKNGKFT